MSAENYIYIWTPLFISSFIFLILFFYKTYSINRKKTIKKIYKKATSEYYLINLQNILSKLTSNLDNDSSYIDIYKELKDTFYKIIYHIEQLTIFYLKIQNFNFSSKKTKKYYFLITKKFQLLEELKSKFLDRSNEFLEIKNVLKSRFTFLQQQTNKIYEYFLELQDKLHHLNEQIQNQFNQLIELNKEFELILYKQNNQYIVSFISNYEEKVINLIYIFKSVFVLESHLKEIIPQKLLELEVEYNKIIETKKNDLINSIGTIYYNFNKKINNLILEAKNKYTNLSFNDSKIIIKEIYSDITTFKKILYLEQNFSPLFNKISNNIKNYFLETIIPTTNEINKSYNSLIELAFINIDLKKIIDQLNNVYSQINFDFSQIFKNTSIIPIVSVEQIHNLKDKLIKLDIYTQLMNKALQKIWNFKNWKNLYRNQLEQIKSTILNLIKEIHNRNLEIDYNNFKNILLLEEKILLIDDKLNQNQPIIDNDWKINMLWFEVINVLDSTITILKIFDITKNLINQLNIYRANDEKLHLALNITKTKLMSFQYKEALNYLLEFLSNNKNQLKTLFK